jgi:hypothetical protein
VIPSVYLVGAPASGKSTLLSTLLSQAGWYVLPDAYKLTPLLWAQRAVDPDSGRSSGLVLGKQRAGGFPGTDALSMGVNPQATAWALTLGDPPLAGRSHPALVLGEGNRLGNGVFLRALAFTTRLHVIALTASDATLDARCDERGSNQAPSWRKGAASSAANAFLAVKDEAASITLLDTTDTTAPELARILLRGPLADVF